MRQQIYEIFPGQPHGRGIHGSNLTVNSDPTVRRNLNGVEGEFTIDLRSGQVGNFADGDLIHIQQVRGLAAGDEENWELNLVLSGGGTNELTLAFPLERDYETTGFFTGVQGYLTTANKVAVVTRVMEYQNVTFNFTITAWNGEIGGNFIWADRGVTKGTLLGNGAQGSVSGSDTGGVVLGGGFRGGWNSNDSGPSGDGENWAIGPGDYSYPKESDTPRGHNGGIGHTGQGNGNGYGHGGGNATVGESNQGSYGGFEAGNEELTSLIFAGGGSGAKSFGSVGAGSNGGANAIGFVKRFAPSGPWSFNGGDASGTGSEGNVTGGAGAGGNLLINCESAVNLHRITCNGGNRRNGTNAGGNGRVRINYGVGFGNTNASPVQSTSHNVRLVNTGGMALVGVV